MIYILLTNFVHVDMDDTVHRIIIVPEQKTWWMEETFVD